MATPWYALPLAGLRRGRPTPSLRRYSAPPASGQPLVSVIVPARNEADSIERCVRSILASGYANLEVVAVDDRSTDGTGDILARIGASDARLRVVRGAELPPGWFGKPWACSQGARLARGALLLFTDADTVHGPELLGRAVAGLVSERVDLFTVLPRQVMATFWERVVLPHFFMLLGLRYGTAVTVNRRTAPRDAIANGQFILVTRASYEAVGGHEAVRAHVVDDVMLAQAYARAGLPRRLVDAARDMDTRMYTSLPHLVEGWSKNIWAGVQVSTGAGPVWTTVLLVVALVLPLLIMAPAAGLVAGLLAGVPWLLAAGVSATLATALAFAGFLRFNGAPGWPGAFFWLGALIQTYILARSSLRGARHIEWKGRTYSHATRVTPD